MDVTTDQEGHTMRGDDQQQAAMFSYTLPEARVPGSTWQNGGSVKFGLDGKFYVSTGGGREGPQADAATDQVLINISRLTTSIDQDAQDRSGNHDGSCGLFQRGRSERVFADA